MRSHQPAQVARRCSVDRVLLTVQDVQDLLQLGRSTVYELIRTGELPSVRIGRSVRIRRETLESWLADIEAAKSTPMELPW